MKYQYIIETATTKNIFFPGWPVNLVPFKNNISVNILLEVLLRFWGQAFPKGFEQWEVFSDYCIF